MADNYIKHPLISYIVVPERRCWVNKATKIGSEQGLCGQQRGTKGFMGKRWMAGEDSMSKTLITAS
jgi:hypothetical protein